MTLVPPRPSSTRPLGRPSTGPPPGAIIPLAACMPEVVVGTLALPHPTTTHPVLSPPLATVRDHLVPILPMRVRAIRHTRVLGPQCTTGVPQRQRPFTLGVILHLRRPPRALTWRRS